MQEFWIGIVATTNLRLLSLYKLVPKIQSNVKKSTAYSSPHLLLLFYNVVESILHQTKGDVAFDLNVMHGN